MPNTEQNRVLVRQGARELSREEVEAVAGNGSTPPCRITFTHLPGGNQDEDTQC
ncbi:MAG TPA: hypothetical protein VFI72_04100 [Candidatus Angelobacter sp.]|nr:hypothetical protein [Candidatus Angelobacter sp.]